MRFYGIGSAGRVVGFVVYLDLRALRESLGKPAEAGIQAEVIENDRAQQLRQFADAGEDFVAYRMADGSYWLNDARQKEAANA